MAVGSIGGGGGGGGVRLTDFFAVQRCSHAFCHFFILELHPPFQQQRQTHKKIRKYEVLGRSGKHTFDIIFLFAPALCKSAFAIRGVYNNDRAKRVGDC